MRRKRPQFFPMFKSNWKISFFMSLFGAIGSHQYFTDPLWLKVPLVALGVVWFATWWSLVLAVGQCYLLPYLKFPSFVATVLATSAAFLLILVLGIPGGVAGTAALAAHGPNSGWVAWQAFKWMLDPKPIGIGFLLMVSITFLFMVRNKLGPGVLENWVLGRFYRPREEERVFMFIDVKDSTALAEKLGNLKFSGLIQQFFSDMSEPLVRSKGEVSHYIGDEAVLTWRLKSGLQPGRVTGCFFDLKNAISSRAHEYEREFGVVPGFKAGAHLGKVVVTQVGEIKSEIVFHGDVLNTTARLQGLCGELDEEFLFSSELASALPCENGLEYVDKGTHVLKGKEEAIGVVAVRRRSSNGP